VRGEATFSISDPVFPFGNLIALIKYTHSLKINEIRKTKLKNLIFFNNKVRKYECEHIGNAYIEKIKNK